MFIPIKTNDGAMTPFEYMEAAAGTYQVGQLLNVTGGKLAAITGDQTATPPYVCMQSGTVKAGEPLAVARVGEKYIFETELAAAADGLTVVDFKTDRVSGEEVRRRAERYRPQIEAYSHALERVLERPVRRRVLYFLYPGETVEL